MPSTGVVANPRTIPSRTRTPPGDFGSRATVFLVASDLSHYELLADPGSYALSGSASSLVLQNLFLIPESGDALTLTAEAAASLTLVPESEGVLTLVAESGDGLTLTAESPDGLTLTPES